MAKKISNSNQEFNPRQYMLLAIEAMRKSIDEPRTDGKVSPKVGAVIVKSNGDFSEKEILPARDLKACSFERIYFSRGSDGIACKKTATGIYCCLCTCFVALQDHFSASFRRGFR